MNPETELKRIYCQKLCLYCGIICFRCEVNQADTPLSDEKKKEVQNLQKST